MPTLTSDERTLEIAALRLEGKPWHRGGVRFNRCLLPLRYSAESQSWVGTPQLPFVPRGLAIWGAPPGAVLSHSVIGPRMQVTCSYGPVPCRFFAFGDSYEQIAKKLDQGQEPPAWCDWDAITVGSSVGIRLEDESGAGVSPTGIELAMWGICSVPVL